MDYEVHFMMDDTYEVVERFNYADDTEYPERNSVYQGNLADCEAYIRLKEGGYMS